MAMRNFNTPRPPRAAVALAAAASLALSACGEPEEAPIRNNAPPAGQEEREREAQDRAEQERMVKNQTIKVGPASDYPAETSDNQGADTESQQAPHSHDKTDAAVAPATEEEAADELSTEEEASGKPAEGDSETSDDDDHFCEEAPLSSESLGPNPNTSESERGADNVEIYENQNPEGLNGPESDNHIPQP